MSANTSKQVIICGGAKKPALQQISEIVRPSANQIYIGVDRGALKLIKKGYQLDYAVGDFDSVTPEEFEYIQAHTEDVKVYSSQKDDTDMEIALELTTTLAPEAEVYIFGAIGETKGRLDHMLANLWMIYQPRYSQLVENMQFIERNHFFKFYQEGTHQIEPRGRYDYLSVITLTPVEDLMIQQAAYNLDKTSFTYPRALISNHFLNEDTPIQLSLSSGQVLVMWVNETGKGKG